jgi:predicted alpha/beta-hydrolase family hydrolase
MVRAPPETAHPLGRPTQLRTAHLQVLGTPTLILQGERDPMGNRAEVERYELSRKIGVEWVPDGDHSFRPRRSAGVTLQENLDLAIAATAKFVDTVTGLG